MPVRYTPPRPEDLLPVPGVRLGHRRREDQALAARRLLLAVFDPGTTAAGVFTQNRFCAAPVIVCRQHLEGEGRLRALVVNAGNANAGTGDGRHRGRPSHVRRCRLDARAARRARCCRFRPA